MKLKQWLYGVMATAMLAACSDKDVAPDAGGGSSHEGSGYVGVRIQMPTVPSTRANDTFDDGVASEYKLNNAVLLLFQGTKGEESTKATCVGAFELQKSQLNATPDDEHAQITTQVTRVATVTGVDISNESDLYALVIVNGTDANALYQMNNGEIDYNTLKLKNPNNEGESTVSFIGKTIQDLQELVINNDLYSQDKNGVGYASNLLMTNSPLTTVQGGTANPGTISGALPVLVKIDNTVWPSEAEALANPAGTIHVERAVGKITCSKINPNTSVTVKVNDIDYALVVDEVYWDMAQDLNTTYLVRNTNRKPVSNPNGANMWLWNYASDNVKDETLTSGGKYRMLGHTPIINTYYRPYFCQVPGYGDKKSDVYENKTFSKTTMEASAAVKWNDASAFYPRENTFPVDFMKYGNTTRIGFWMTFKFKQLTNDGKDAIGADGQPIYLNMEQGDNFYTKGLDKTTIYLNDSNGKDPLTSEVIAALTADERIKNAVEEAMDKESNKSYSDLYLGDFLNITYDDNRRDGQIIITKISFKDFKDDVYSSTKYEDLFIKAPVYSFDDDIANLNNLDQVYRYTGGKVFYEVRIKHFGDDLTPWSKEDHEQAGTIEESYGPSESRSRNYLGRYGIVRNNWYDLTVSVISRLGDPEDPAKWDNSWPGKPDDNKDEYIAIELRVLSWAKRTQNVEF